MPSERVQRRIESLLDRAEEAADRFDWPVVAEAARMVLQADPDNEDAAVFLSMVEQADSAVTKTSSFADAAADVFLGAPTPSTPNTPTSFASGRYSVSKFLGEGGKKKVYLAHDNTLDRDVAFALIKTEGLDETSRERVRREAQAMGRMGTHPAIMPIYDLGDESGQPFMVQPLMSGGDVEGLIEDAEGPLELERAITIATQTAQGLSFAHGKGIVHRDLKPGNVWLDEDGAAKIGDFGLAVATDRSRLTVEKLMVGTVNYMPPEQATGGVVTPKADFYSLGAMLYEMCTGRVPFMGDDDISVISQHVNTPPVAPSWHNPEIPRTLDSLIIRLMSKDPAERPESAQEILDALGAVDLSISEQIDPGKGSLDSMAGGVFVGRQREMDQLKSIFEDMLSGRGRMVTLVGEPGIGKTRTAQELATYASMRGAQVLWGRSYESGGAPPYWPWVQAIRSHVASTEPDTLSNQMGSTASIIADVVVDVREKLPDLPQPTPIDDPETARFRLFDSIATFLKQAASTTPVVLMLEDLHWSDKPSLLLLEFVARELANAKILVIGNYRDMELNRRHPLSVTLGDLSRERLFERVVLRGLQKHDVQRFVEIAAGITPPQALVEAVYSQTEGNPLFVTETVRLLIQEGDITAGRATGGGTTSWEIRIPEGVREVIGRRLDRLSERCNELLTIAAVIGRQFRFDVLKMLMEDTTDGQLLDAMDEALSARIIEELPGEVGFYQFTHAQMQETLIQELSHTRAVRMHARIAEALEDYYGEKANDHSAELAEHFAEAETVLGLDRLVRYSIVAGEAALERWAFEDARPYLERADAAIKDSGDSLTRARLLHRLGFAMIGTSHAIDIQNGWEKLAESHRMYQALDATYESVEPLLEGVPLHTVRGALAVFRNAVTQTSPDHPLFGWLLTRFAISLRAEERDSEQEREVLSQAREHAIATGDRPLEARIMAHLAQSYTDTVEPQSAIAAGMESLELDRAQPDPSTSSRATVSIADSYARLGQVKKATEYAALATGIHEATRYRSLLEGDRSRRAKWRRMEGDFAASDAMVHELADAGAINASINWLEVVGLYDIGDLEKGDEILRNGLVEWKTINYFGANVPCIATFVPILGYRQVFDEYEKLLRSAIGIAQNPLSTRQELERNVALAMLAVGKGDSGEAASRQSLIKPYEGLANVEQLIVIDRVLGHIAVALGNLDQAESYFGAAVKLSRQAGWKRELALASGFHSEVLLARDVKDDLDRVQKLQDEAIAIATELGMKPLLERVLAKREILKA